MAKPKIPLVKWIAIQLDGHKFYFEFTVGLTSREQLIETMMYVLQRHCKLNLISFEEIYDLWFLAHLKL